MSSDLARPIATPASNATVYSVALAKEYDAPGNLFGCQCGKQPRKPTTSDRHERRHQFGPAHVKGQLYNLTPSCSGPPMLVRSARTKIVFWADSGFCRDLLLSWCDRHDVKYVVGIARNADGSVAPAGVGRD